MSGIITQSVIRVKGEWSRPAPVDSPVIGNRSEIVTLRRRGRARGAAGAGQHLRPWILYKSEEVDYGQSGI